MSASAFTAARSVKSRRVRVRVLADSAVAATTLKRYQSAVLGFHAWAAENGEDADNEEELDELVTEYIEEEYEAGGSRQRCANLINGLAHYSPKLRFGLLLARRSLKGWRKLRPSQSWPPLTWDCCCAIIAVLLKAGRVHAAVAVATMYKGLLRISEVCGLRLCDVAFNDDPRLSGANKGVAVGLRLRKTKTADNLFAQLRDPAVGELLRRFVNLRKMQCAGSEDSLFQYSPGQLRRLFRKACDSLGLHGMVPHSCRHGAATELYAACRSIELVMEIGRWAATTSARHYLQSARALLINQQLPVRTTALGARVSKSLLALFAAANAFSTSSKPRKGHY